MYPYSQVTFWIASLPSWPVEFKILKLRLRTYSKPFFGDAIEAFFGRGNIGDFDLCVNGKSTLTRLHF